MGVVCCKPEEIDLQSEVDLSHFTLLRSVGRGAFGKVRVVQHRGTKQLFALKYINKAKCIQMNAVENIISERKILEQVTHSFIVNLRYAFQDDENLFMILDLMLGGDLRFHLDRLGVMPESYVQFYAAEIALGLRHLHKNNVVHRDIKPDNILLNERGHAHLTDFNIAVQFNKAKPLTSVAGSMAYMAPEILQKRGYFASVDWWSLGIMCFELLFGKRPFRGKTNEALQHAILYDPLVFPENHKISADAIDFITGLLNRDISQRLGVDDRGFQSLMSHRWMKNIQWSLLENKQVTAPFIPDTKRANFDPSVELEEILLEDKPLTVRRRNHARNGSNVNMSNPGRSTNESEDISPEQQMMEERFLTFDYTKPEENEWRKKEIEMRWWSEQMAKPSKNANQNGQPKGRRPVRKRRAFAGTYDKSVLEYVNEKPVTPLSAGDILKLEELSRLARTGVGREQGTDWRPPSGILPYGLDDNTINAIQARDDYILQSGGVPPPIRPPPFFSGTRYRRRSSDESYVIQPSSPENSERPLVGTATSSLASIPQQNEPYIHSHHQNQPSHSPPSAYASRHATRTSSPTTQHPSPTTHTFPTASLVKTVEHFPPALPPPASLPPPIPDALPPLPPLPQDNDRNL